MSRTSKGERKRRQKERKKLFDSLWRLGLHATWQAAIMRDQASSWNFRVHLIEHGEHDQPNVSDIRTACGKVMRIARKLDSPYDAQETSIGRQHGIGGLCKQCINGAVRGY